MAELAARLDVAGFQVNLYDSSALVLVETDRRGRCLLSDYRPVSTTSDSLGFHGEQIAEDRLEVRFELLPIQTLVEECSSADWCSNSSCVEALIPHQPLLAHGGLELYFEWPMRDRAGSNSGIGAP